MMPVSAETLAAADANFVAAWRAILAFSPRLRIVDGEDGVLLSSGESVGLFNPAFMLRAGRDPDEAVDRVLRHYATLGVPFTLYARHELWPGLASSCSARGLVEHWRPPLMVLEPIPDQANEPAPPELTIVRLDEGNHGEYMAVLAEGFGMPGDLAHRVLARPVMELASAGSSASWTTAGGHLGSVRHRGHRGRLQHRHLGRQEGTRLWRSGDLERGPGRSRARRRSGDPAIIQSRRARLHAHGFRHR